MSEPIAASVTPPAAASAGLGHFLKRHLRDYGMLLSLVAIMALFEVLTDGTLLEPLNLTNLVLQNSYIVIMALGML
ncbi:sugar ABC transporter permease, partial [Roseateles sp. 22389]